MTAVIKKRRGTAAAWTSANPVLAAGEEGFETDTRKSKVGDGSTAWTSLLYTVSAAPATPTLAAVLAAGASAGAAITNLTNPSSAQDAATKFYVDAVAQGLSIKASCRLATAAALPAVTLVGSTLVAAGVGVLTVDGQVVALNDRVLVKDQVAGAQNGIYTCTTAGTGIVAFILTRATDSDTSAEIVGGFTFIEEGTVNAAAGFVNTNSGTITVGTTAITYTQFSGAGEITAGAALTKTGNTLDVAVDGATIEVNSDALRVKDGGITSAKLASGVVPAFATNALALGSAAAAGAATTVIRSNDTIAAFDATVPVTQAFGDAAATGSAAFAARRDHVHGMPAAPAGGLAVFGDGSDGTVTFDGTTTILGIVPNPNSASVGVYTLARDIFLANGSALNSGISIITNGFRIFCAGTFTNNGTIKWNGNNASGATAGTATSNANGSINISTNASAPGTAGGNGSTSGAGSTGAVGTNNNGGMGGNGGVGGAGAGAGGAAGTITAVTATHSAPRWSPLSPLMAVLASSGAPATFQGGGGGGGGSGDGTHAGGGGGSGGGMVMVSVKVFAGTGSITATGGNGANAVALGTNSGGGAGGGGGVVIVVSSSVSAGAISGQTITAAGGTHGTKLGTGSDGNDGSPGTVILIPN